MSVIIKGMKMPGKCTACEYFYYEPLFGIQRCKLTNLFIEGYSGDFPESCPLVELPEKHGDLIDRTTLLKEFELAQKSADMHGREFANAFYSSGNEISTEWWAVEELVENAIAVIEAEDGTCTM